MVNQRIVKMIYKILEEAFLFNFIVIGIFFVYFSFISLFTSEINWDSQTLVILSLACFGTYAFMVNLFFKEEKEECIRGHIILLFVIIVLYPILYWIDVILSIANIDIYFFEPVMNNLFETLFEFGIQHSSSNSDIVRHSAYQITMFYFLFFGISVIMISPKLVLTSKSSNVDEDLFPIEEEEE